VPIVYLNGEFVDASQARVAVEDAGLLSAHGLFETFRARNGGVFRLVEHMARLHEGAHALGIEVPKELPRTAETVCELAARNDLVDARVRVTLTAGAPGGRPTVLIQAREAVDYPDAFYREGAAAVIAATRRNESSPLSRIKSLNYLDNLIARREAQSMGRFDALFLNTRGRLAEGAVTNVFVVAEGVVVTPPVGDGALPGVTRAAILELATFPGIREASIEPDTLYASDEAFLTNSLIGVLPLVQVGEKRIGDGEPGPVTLRIRQVYEEAALGPR
jgi:branched-subunit amino acid aminotransferase/4-amino-4-deoxychorismate lyase